MREDVTQQRLEKRLNGSLDPYRVSPHERVSARIVPLTNGYKIELGNRAFSVSGEQNGDDLRECADFALYGLAALGMFHNLEIDFEASVTSDAFTHIQEMGRMWEDWRLPGVHPLRLHVSDCVEPTKTPRSGAIICQSSGVDATYSALRDKERIGLSHGLFITGSDFLSTRSHGHDVRMDRVTKLTERLGLEPIWAQTDIRRCGFPIFRFQAMLLSMCLHYSGAGMAYGAFASDHMPQDEPMIFDWATNIYLFRNHFGTNDFPVRVLGYERRRAARLNYILQKDEALGSLLSVCYMQGNEGANCGKCEKCVRTRLNLACFGHDQRLVFSDHMNLVQYFSTAKIPSTEYDRRNTNLFIADVIHLLDDGELRDVLVKYSNNLLKPVA